MAKAPNYVSMGRNPNVEPTCSFPRCGHLKSQAGKSGGWCQHPDNRVPPCDGWPTGFTPSVAATGGCDLHTSNAAVKAGDCVHCGKDICNDLGWCNDFKAAPAAGVTRLDESKGGA